MEQKRTLWIVLAVGFFLLVVIGTALFLYAPSAKKPQNSVFTQTVVVSETDKPKVPETGKLNVAEIPAETSSEIPAETPLPIVADSAEIPSDTKNEDLENQETSLQTENLTVFANGTTNLYNFNPPEMQKPVVIPKSPAAEKVMKETGEIKKNYETSNIISSGGSSNTPSVKSEPASSYKSASSAASTAKPSAKPSAKVSSSDSYTAPKVSVSNSSAKTSATKTTSSPAKTVTKEPDRFWIQIASYASKKSADEAREIISGKGMPCEVFTVTDSKNTLYFRVRVGPYTTKNEASYWKGEIEKIEKFKGAGSYITNSSASAK